MGIGCCAVRTLLAAVVCLSFGRKNDDCTQERKDVGRITAFFFFAAIDEPRYGMEREIKHRGLAGQE